MQPPPADRFRKRSSSFTESSGYQSQAQHRPTNRKKPSYEKHMKNHVQTVEAHQYDAYNVPQATRLSPDETRKIKHGHNARDLQPTLFDTNLNIRMQYLTRSSGHLSISTPVNPAWTQATSTQNVRPPALSRQLSGPTTVHHNVQKPPPNYTGKRNEQQVYRQMDSRQNPGYNGGYNMHGNRAEGHGSSYEHEVSNSFR